MNAAQTTPIEQVAARIAEHPKRTRAAAIARARAVLADKATPDHQMVGLARASIAELIELLGEPPADPWEVAS